MLDSLKIQRRQSEIRQQLAALVGKDKPSEDEIRSIETMDSEFRTNETRFRAALIAENEERQEAAGELESRSDRQFAEMMGNFEMRQIVLALDEGRQLDGETAEIVQELRSSGGFRGIPVPWQALEQRNTVSGGTPDPISTRPIIDRLFPDSMASRMGAQAISIDSGAVEWPVVTSSVTAGWAPTEGGNVAGPTPYTTTDRAMSPDHNLGVQMRVTRKALKQSGSALEQAIRRDMAGAMGQAMDQAVFLGTGADGQPLGVIAGAATYGITVQQVDALASWAAFRQAVTAFMVGNAASGPNAIRAMIRPELWDYLDGEIWDAGSGTTEWDRLVKHLPNIGMTSNGLAAPAGGTLSSSALLTTATGGVSPVFVGLFGAADLIRDPFTDAQSGGLRITALATMDVTVARPVQLRVLTGLQTATGA